MHTQMNQTKSRHFLSRSRAFKVMTEEPQLIVGKRSATAQLLKNIIQEFNKIHSEGGVSELFLAPRFDFPLPLFLCCCLYIDKAIQVIFFHV